MVKINKSFLTSVIILLLLYSTDTFIVFSNTKAWIKTIFQILMLCMFLALVFGYKKANTNAFILFITLSLPIVLSIVVNSDFSGGNLIKLFLFALGLMISSYVDWNSFKKIYVNIVAFIALYSLVAFSLSIVFHKWLYILPVLENTSGTRVYYLGICNIPVTNGIPRNYGPFWEPGVFSIYLNLALLFNLRIDKKITIQDIVIALCIMSTFSTVGIIVFMIIVFEYAFLQSGGGTKGREIFVRISVIMFFILLIAIIVSNETLRETILAKFNRSDYRYVSTSSRLNSITGNLYIWINNPIFGVGATNLSTYFADYCAQKGAIDMSNTNCILMHFSMYGLFEGIIIILCLLKLSLLCRRNTINRLVVFILLVMMLSCEPLMTSLMFNTLIFYGIKKEMHLYNE